MRRLQCRSAAVYSGAHGFNDEEIRGKLQNFPGGSIDLIKQDSGIAVMTVNNPARMNAFSGRPSLDYLSRHDDLEMHIVCAVCVSSATVSSGLFQSSSKWITS